MKSVVAAFVILGTLLILGGCGASKGEGFAIYFTKTDVPPSQMQLLSHVEIADQPVISEGDLLSYDAKTHEMTLTSKAFDRISKLAVPTTGISFVVCVDRKPIYSGAFWVPWSSASYSGVTICKGCPQVLSVFDDSAPHPKSVVVELGYPSPSFYHGEDPRSNAEVMKALRDAGKLK